MARWGDIAAWRQAADNFGDGDYTTGEPGDRMLAVVGVTLHVAEGTGPGTISWCSNPGSDIGPHFVVDRDGAITQMVDTDDYSWCQAAGNRYWLSVENAGWSGQPLTAPQVEANARILAKAHQVYGVPLQAADRPDGRGLGWHGMGGAAWGGHYNCPGDPIKAQRPAIIAMAQQILASPQPAVDEEDDMDTFMQYEGHPAVFQTDGKTAVWVRTEEELSDRAYLGGDDGSWRISLRRDRANTIDVGGVPVRQVGRKELIGVIVGAIPDGWDSE